MPLIVVVNVNEFDSSVVRMVPVVMARSTVMVDDTAVHVPSLVIMQVDVEQGSLFPCLE